MGRQRKNKIPGVPEFRGWQYVNGTHYYKVEARFRHLFEKQWIRLGKDTTSALRTYLDLPIHEAIDSSRIRTINQLADAYEKEVLPTNAVTYQKEKARYLKSIRVALGRMLVSNVKRKHGLELFSELVPIVGLKSARETFAVLRHMLTFAVNRGLIDQNLLIGTRLPANKPRRRHVTYQEAEQFAHEYGGKLLSVYIPLKLITGMDKAMLLALTESDIQEDGLHTQRLKNDSLPKVYPYDAEGQLKDVLDAILAYKRSLRVRSIYLFPNREGRSYLPVGPNKRLFDAEGRAWGKSRGFNSIWTRRMAKWVEDGHEHFTEHDLRKTPASAAESSDRAQALLDHKDKRTTERVYIVGEKVVPIQPKPKSTF